MAIVVKAASDAACLVIAVVGISGSDSIVWRRWNKGSCSQCLMILRHLKHVLILIGVFSLLIDLLVISYALVLLFHLEYAVVPSRYPDSYESNRHHSDVVPSSTVETDHAAVNLTAAVFSGNTSSSLRSICWTNCDDHFISLILTFVSAVLAVCLLYGTIRVRHSLLLHSST